MNTLLNLNLSPLRSKWRKRFIIPGLLMGTLFVVCCSAARKPDWTVAAQDREAAARLWSIPSN